MAAEEGLPWANTLYCYFISIAAIIGTGILAIPVKLYDTGFMPFALPFTVTMLTQVALVYMTTELLQISDPVFLRESAAPESIPLEDMGAKQDTVPEDEAPSTETSPESKVKIAKENISSLYQIGIILLPPFWQPVFSLCTVAHLGVFLVSYALAGAKATCQV